MHLLSTFRVSNSTGGGKSGSLSCDRSGRHKPFFATDFACFATL
jgi:hypothetical protein